MHVVVLASRYSRDHGLLDVSKIMEEEDPLRIILCHTMKLGKGNSKRACAKNKRYLKNDLDLGQEDLELDIDGIVNKFKEAMQIKSKLKLPINKQKVKKKELSESQSEDESSSSESICSAPSPGPIARRTRSLVKSRVKTKPKEEAKDFSKVKEESKSNPHNSIDSRSSEKTDENLLVKTIKDSIRLERKKPADQKFTLSFAKVKELKDEEKPKKQGSTRNVNRRQ